MSNIFFSAGYCFSQEFLCILFSSSQNQSAGYLFSEITHKPFKSQIVGPLNPPNICSVDRFWFAIISNTFWNNRGQNSLGERWGIRCFFPLPGESVRTDVRWRHNQNFSDGWFTKFYYPWCSAARARASLWSFFENVATTLHVHWVKWITRPFRYIYIAFACHQKWTERIYLKAGLRLYIREIGTFFTNRHF